MKKQRLVPCLLLLRAYPNNSEQVLGSTTCGYSILVEPKIQEFLFNQGGYSDRL
jgi:hypothetical protein